MKQVFGFDIGTTSIGWAVVHQKDPDFDGQIVATGVRIFPEARDSEGTPLNQQRRLARQMRRQVRRRRERRRHLAATLSDMGLLPIFGTQDWVRVMAMEPYDLRRDALTRALTQHELGRVLYHVSKRRHFRGKDLEEGTDVDLAADEKEAKSERERLVAALSARDTTLGSYLSSLPMHVRKRGHHAARQNVIDEFHRIVAAQVPYHPALNDPPHWARIEDAIFAQKPVFWRRNTLGHCRLIPDQEPAAKSSWLSCQRRMLEKLNNLEISGGNRRPLDDGERHAILEKLQVQNKMSWGAAKTILKAVWKGRGEETKHIKFNLEEGGDKGLLGNPIEAKLADIFGQDWNQHPAKDKIRDAVDERLRAADYGQIGSQRIVILREAERKARKKVAAASFARDFGATDTQIAKLEEMTFGSGWEAYSPEAIRIILPELAKGIKIGDLLSKAEWQLWRDSHFPQREQPTGEILDLIPSPANKEEAQRLRNIRNPTVIRILNELRKVTNNLVRTYGKPELIRVELARDVGLSKAERDEKSKAMRSREKIRKKAETDLKANGIAEPSGRDIEKWLLWEECGRQDPYSGQMISFDALFNDNEFEVEHIWPRSLSLDDSFANKTLCRRDLNILKGQRLPFEAFGHDEENWNTIQLRVGAMSDPKAGSGMSRGKARRFLTREIPSDFASRQLNDTGYATKAAVASLKRLWADVGPEGKVNVQTVTGKVTAHVRKYWGLNNILADDGEKSRADHRHHAIDAIVVACCDPGVTQRLSRFWQIKYGPEGAASPPVLTPPWPTIRHDAEKAIANIVVSHRVRKKVSGALHSGSVYGDTKRDMTVAGVEYRIVVERVPLSSLSLADLLSDNLEKNRYMIADSGIRKAISLYLKESGIDIDHYNMQKKIKVSAEDLKRLEQIIAKPIPFGMSGTVIRKVRVLTRKQMHLLAPVHNGLSPEDSNHHIAIYRSENGEFREVPVSLISASRRIQSGKNLISKLLDDGSRLVFSVSKGDMIQFDDDRSRYWVVRMIASHGQILIVPHFEARPDKDAIKYAPYLKSLMIKNVKKISIDPIGRIRPAND